MSWRCASPSPATESTGSTRPFRNFSFFAPADCACYNTPLLRLLLSPPLPDRTPSPLQNLKLATPLALHERCSVLILTPPSATVLARPDDAHAAHDANAPTLLAAVREAVTATDAATAALDPQVKVVARHQQHRQEVTAAHTAEDVVRSRVASRNEAHRSRTWPTCERTHSRTAASTSATCPMMSSGII